MRISVRTCLASHDRLFQRWAWERTCPIIEHDGESIESVSLSARCLPVLPMARRGADCWPPSSAPLRAIRRAGRGSSGSMRSARSSPLTPREREVFELVVRGKTNKQIARELGAAERTIKAHRQKVWQRFRSSPSQSLYRLPSGSASCQRPKGGPGQYGGLSARRTLWKTARSAVSTPLHRVTSDEQIQVQSSTACRVRDRRFESGGSARRLGKCVAPPQHPIRRGDAHVGVDDDGGEFSNRITQSDPSQSTDESTFRSTW